MVVSASVPCVVYDRCQGSTLTLTLTRLALLLLVVLCSAMNTVKVHAMIQARPVSSRALLSSSASSLRFSRRSSSFHGAGGSCMMRVHPRFGDRSRGTYRRSSSSSSWAASASSNNNNKIDEHEKNDARSFLGEIETTVSNVLSHYAIDDSGAVDMQDLPESAREAVGVAKHLDQRLANAQRNNDCRTCWLQRAHCICQDCPPAVVNRAVDKVDIDAAVTNNTPNTNIKPNNNRVARLQRLFLVYHHKEICLAVDTAKLLASTLYSAELDSSQVRVVVGGIPAEFQESMKELEEAVQQKQAGGGTSCLVLFPDDTARTWRDFQVEQQQQQQQQHIRNNDDDSDRNNINSETDTADYDVIVLDGTWEQARKLYRRYVPEEESGGPYRIQLELEALEKIVGVSGASVSNSGEDDGNADANASGTGTGRQLRRHPVLWREIGTTAATGSLLQDMDPDGPWETILAQYQQRADAGARAQLGAPRMRLREQKTKRS
jgi:DTW domain-containing protein YfiP